MTATALPVSSRLGLAAEEAANRLAIDGAKEIIRRAP